MPAQQIEPSSKSAPKSDWERVCLQHVTVESGCSELDVTLSTFSKDEDLEQLEKLAKLIKDLKAQEKAYVDFVQRNIVSIITISPYAGM